MKIENSKLKIIFVFPLFFILYSLFLNKVNAQSLSLSIYPSLLEVMIKPGKSITQVYKLANEGESDLVFRSRIVPFTLADELGNIVIKETKNEINKAQDENMFSAFLATQATDWFSFQNADLQLGQKFILPAGREQEVVLKIKIPENAPEGDYYATLLFETIPSVLLPSGSGGQIEAKIGSNILLTISQSGKPLKQAQIEQFSLANFQFSIFNFQFIDSFTHPQFIVRLKNTGNAFFKPLGTITTNGWFNQRWVLDLLPENVLVDSVRQIPCQKSKEKSFILPSPCQLEAKFLLGKYTARLEFGLDEESGEYQSQIVFWAIPLKLGVGILVTLILLLFIGSKITVKK